MLQEGIPVGRARRTAGAFAGHGDGVGSDEELGYELLVNWSM